jgi:hypothetical protein
MRMNTVSKMTVVCILAILVVVISSVSYSMIRVNAIVQGKIEELPLDQIAPGCKDLQARMANDTPDHFYAGLFKEFDCANVLAKVP